MAVLPPDPVFNLRCPEMGAVNSICFHQNERLLAGTVKGTGHLWDLQTNRSCLHFEIGSDPVTSLHHTDDNLISQEKGGRIKCWNMANTGYILHSTIEANHPAFCRSDMTSDRDSVVFPKDENTIALLGVNDFQMHQTLTPDVELKLGHISCLKAVNINGQTYILAGYESGHLLSWDLRICKVINHIQLDEMPLAVDYDVLTNRGVCAGPGDKISVISYQKQSMEMKKTSEIGIKNSGINCLRIRNDQKVFSSGGWDGRIRIFSWKSLRPLAVLTEHKTGGVMDIAYSTEKVSMWNARIMAAAGVDGQITLWDLYN